MDSPTTVQLESSPSLTRMEKDCNASLMIYFVSMVRYLPEVSTSTTPGGGEPAEGLPSTSRASGLFLRMKTSVSYSFTTKSPSALKKQSVWSKAFSSNGTFRYGPFLPDWPRPLPSPLEYGPDCSCRSLCGGRLSSSDSGSCSFLLSTRSSSAMSSFFSVVASKRPPILARVGGTHRHGQK